MKNKVNLKIREKYYKIFVLWHSEFYSRVKEIPYVFIQLDSSPPGADGDHHDLYEMHLMV